ncbi:MAG TPA: proprotein convertase P-domain-containing protein, partial [Lacipirellulaceae bacterium]|nr:proprotein convertase P-domain-containing protein [Lacipirellulaceae bacterium]
LPLPGSPVIDAGDPSATAGGGVPLFDQRGSGFDRIRNGDSNPGARIDIGAVEIQPGSIHGQKWSDLNGDGVHDSNEPGLSGWTIYLDMNHNDVFDTNQAAIEPDDYSIGTDLSSIVPGATLSYAGSPGSIVTANAGVASTGSQVIGGTWDNGTQLRVDFANPTNFVGIDVVSDDEFDLGILEAFDAGGNLLATYFSAPLTAFGQFETISISRPTADIAYVLASGYNGEAVYLDNLRFGSSEPFRVTDPDGNYSFPELPPGTYQVGEVAQPGWQQTSPSSLASTLAQITANSAAISALVPSRFDFSEGDVGSAIFDGGNDMYDGGNVLGTEFSSSIAYTNGVVTPGDLAFGPGSQYFTAKFPGLFVMAANNTSINSFAISGDNGADGGGSTFADQLSTTVNGQLYTIYVKRVYNAGDPSINHILIVPGNGAGITHTYSTNTNDDYDNLLSLSSVHQIYYALVARQNGLFLSSSDVLNIANELLSNVGSVLTQSVTVNSGQATDGVDFGNHPLPGSIRGQLWYDTNGDGIKDPGEPPLEGWTVFLDTNHDGTLNGETVSVSSTDVPRLIFDSLTTYSTISVTGLHSINDLDVFLDIAHTFDSGLQVFLTSPNGTRVHLFGGVGGSGDNFMSTTLDDEAATGIGDGIAPFDGSFRPQELLSAFDGQDPNGIWTLEVSDTLSAGFGVLNNWSLNITDSEPTAVTDADGNYSFSDLPYGSYLVGEVLPNGWKQTHPGGPAATNLIANGGFETGDFGGWTLENSGSGTFVVNNGSVFPTSGDGASVPFDGAFSALTDQSGPGTHSIYQDVAVPVGSHLTLNWVDRIHNLAGSFIPPLQQYRVEFRDAGNNVIATPFSTQLGDLSVQDWTPRSVDLSAYAGQTIRIAFVEEDNFGYFNLGLDDVAITSSNGVSTISVMVHPGESVGGVQFGNQLTLRGDFNLDGSVDAADYIVWRQALGHSGATFVDADASGNGIIDDADYNIWRNHFGESVPPPSSGASFRSVEATAAPAPQNAAIANFTGVDHPATFNELAPGYRHFTPVPDANGIHHNVALFLGTNRAPAPNADLAVLQPHSLKVRAIGLSNSPITLRRVVEAAVPPAIRSATRDDALLYYLSLHLPAHVKVTADAITADSLPDAKSEQRVDSLEEAFDQVGDDEFWKLPELTA